jgi:pre-mRNA-splicing factor ATP-dependent RNA helicase DHX15/PRP43
MSAHNPYLAHLNQPDANIFPGATTSTQAEVAEDHQLNHYTGRPHSQKYKDILAKRRNLPVHKQRDEFLKIIHENQMMILVGETGKFIHLIFKDPEKQHRSHSFSVLISSRIGLKS